MGLLPICTGTHLHYYYVCQRKLWLFSHALSMEHTSDTVSLGRLIHETTYVRQKQELTAPGMKIDFVKEKDGNLAVMEVKKSSRNLLPAQMQLVYYLWRLEEMGVNAKGELLIPKERKRIPVELTDEVKGKLEEAMVEIGEIIALETPPPPVWNRFCRPCAYAEFCWT